MMISSSSRRDRASSFDLLRAALAAIVVLFVFVPLARLVVRLFYVDGSFNGDAFRRAFQDPDLAVTLGHTALVVLSSTLLATIAGTILAWLNERTDAAIPLASRALPLMPLLLPPIAGAIGWTMLASPVTGLLNVWIRNGLSIVGIDLDRGPLDIYSWWGVVLVYTITLIPYVYLTVAAALQQLDPSIEEASRISGCSPFRTFIHVTTPAVRPAITAGALLAFMIGITTVSVPTVLASNAGLEILSLRIVRLAAFTYPAQLDEALVLSLILVACITVGWALQRRTIRGASYARLSGQARRNQPIRLTRGKRLTVRIAMVLFLVIVSILPLTALVLSALQPFWSPRITWSRLSLRNFREVFFDDRMARSAMQNSLLLAVVGATIGIVVAAMLATYIHDRRGEPGARIVESATKVPATVSHLVVGLAFLITFAGSPVRLAGTTLLLLITYLVLCLPQATISSSGARDQVPAELLEAARLGAVPATSIFRRILLPLMSPGLTAGWTLLFVIIIGEISASAMLAGRRNPVIGFVIMEQWGGTGTIGKLSAIALVVAFVSFVAVTVVFGLSHRLARRSSRRRPSPVGGVS